MSSIPIHADGRFLFRALTYMLRVGTARLVSRWSEGRYVNVPDSLVVCGRAWDQGAWIVADPIDAHVVRLAVWLHDHTWDLDRLAIRLGLKRIAEGDYYVNARWFWRARS